MDARTKETKISGGRKAGDGCWLVGVNKHSERVCSEPSNDGGLSRRLDARLYADEAGDGDGVRDGDGPWWDECTWDVV